jgi:hypothetical protein
MWSGLLLLLVSLGAWVVVLGASALNCLAAPGPRVKAAAKRCVWLAWGTLFLSPFAYFWHRAPWLDYLTANVVLLAVCAVALLLSVDRLALRLAEFFRDETLAVMARIGEIACYVMIVFPMMAGFLGLCVVCHLRQQPFLNAIGEAMGWLHPWAKAIVLAPACFTVALLWTLKAVALAQIEELESRAPAPTEAGKRGA